MIKVLVITASPLAEHSVSCKMANVFVESYGAAHPDEDVKTLDLNKIVFPSIDKTLIDYFNGETLEDSRKFEEIDRLCQEFMDSDKIVFALPHWNLTVPPVVVNYSLAVMRAGKSFCYTENGPQGLLHNKKAAILLASGGTCNTDNPIMHCYGVDWLKGILGLCGIFDVSVIYAQGMEERPDAVQKIVDQAYSEVEDFSRKW